MSKNNSGSTSIKYKYKLEVIRFLTFYLYNYLTLA